MVPASSRKRGHPADGFRRLLELLFRGAHSLRGACQPVPGMRENPVRTAGIRRGDAREIEAVIHEVLPGLLRAARAAGLSPDRAEDTVHASVLVFLKRSQDFDGRARASTWIHGILVHKIAEERRSLRRDEAREDIDEVVEARFDAAGSWSRPPGGPAGDLARSEIERFLQLCMEDMPDRQRLAFVLREVEGFTTGEICKILEVSSNNVGVLLFRARNRLRECLESKGVEGPQDAHV